MEVTRYAPIKYFISRYNDSSNNKLECFEFWHGQYMKGYHKSMNSFLSNLIPGRYYIYIKIENEVENKAKYFSINLVTNAHIREFKESILITPEEKELIFRSTFYSHTKKTGVKVYMHPGSKEFLVRFNDKFEEYGYGVISLDVHEKSKGELCMTVDKR